MSNINGLPTSNINKIASTAAFNQQNIANQNDPNSFMDSLADLFDSASNDSSDSNPGSYNIFNDIINSDNTSSTSATTNTASTNPALSDWDINNYSI